MKNTNFIRTETYLKNTKLFTESEIKILAKELQYISEEQLNEWSLKDLKAKAQQILAKAKEKTKEVVDKAKSGELTQAAAKKIKAAKDTTADALKKLNAKAKEHGLGDKAANILSKVKSAASAAVSTAGKATKTVASATGSAAKKSITKVFKIKPETLDNIIDKTGKISFSLLYKTFNTASGGNISDQVIEYYMNKIGNSLSEDELKETINDLSTKFPKLKKKIAKDDKASAKEDNEKAADAAESTEIDEATCKFYAMFNDETGKLLREAAISIDNEAVKIMDSLAKMEKEAPKVADELVGDEINDEDKQKYGILIAMLAAKGLKGKELKAEFEKQKKATNESVKKFVKTTNFKQKLLTENKSYLTEKQRLFERILAVNIINEAWNLSDIFAGGDGDETGIFNFITKHFKGSGLSWSDEISSSDEFISKFNSNGDSYSKFASAMTNDETRPALGMNLNVVGPLAAIGIGAVLYKFRKPIINGITRGIQNIKNKKGVIASIQFKTKSKDENGKTKNEYKLQFSVTDFVWRVINLSNSKKLVKEELVKDALDSEVGKKFRQKCQELWAPLFGIPDNNKIPVFYKTIDAYADTLKLSKSDVRAIMDFGDNFKKIAETCLSDDYKYDIRHK